MTSQSTDTILMVTPDHFKYNSEAAETNSFQQNTIEQERVSSEAWAQFRAIQDRLKEQGVHLITIDSRADGQETPDAVFPNNWFSTHFDPDTKETSLVLYPMLNPSRRAERQVDKLLAALKQHSQNPIEIKPENIIDLTYFEEENKALEGTGSLVLDRIHKIAYASRSPRMDESILQVFCEKMGYSSVVFSSYNHEEKLFYHTNVMMSVGTDFAVICSESIRDEEERRLVLDSLKNKSGKKQIFEVTLEQMNKMCCNILEVQSSNNNTAGN
jgi:hypothetical protein